MFRKIEDFVQTWTYEMSATQKLMDQLTDASLSQSIADGYRTLGRLAWHITTSTPEMMSRVGLKVSAVDPHAPMPKTAKEIARAYAKASKEFLDQIKSSWKDEDLLIVDDMYGEKWMRGNTAFIIVKHEAHHRGQMTVLMRQAGLRVPGVYGPSKEEWVSYGMPAQE